jgi:hypothetical protein
MRSIKTIAVAFLLVFSATLFGGRAQAQQVPGPHPEYLHALSDLRLARAYLDELGPNIHVDNRSQLAISEIDEAMNAIKKASIDDGKNLHEHPPIDVHLGHKDRFKTAEHLLHKVHDDLSHAEDVPQARGLRNNALFHVDKAWHATQDALNAATN